MEKPILSPNFTIEDIHKLREYNYFVTKDMTSQERIDYYNQLLLLVVNGAMKERVR